MSSRFNFNDNTDDIFGFTIGGKDYDFAYPSMNDLKPLQAKFSELRKLDNDNSEEATNKKEELNEDVEEIMYSFITPVGHDTPVKETLETVNVKVYQSFIKKLTELLSE